MNEQEFREHIQSLGYSEPQIVELEPDKSGPLHKHDFSAIALVLRGSVTLAFENESIFSEPGEFGEIAAGVLHDERTGPDGVTVLLATK